METIVVGVDGSETSQSALAFAATEAARHGAKLRIVAAWEIHPALVTAPYNESIDAVRELAEQVAKDAVAKVGSEHPELECEAVALEGQPADVLIQECEKAKAYMIVVGSRGQGGFTSLLLGSTSQQVIHHANCPVLVVRGVC
jgi:nucleotide-binding universal stress UspA family protein